MPWQRAKEWAAAELLKKGPPADPVLDILTREADLATLTHERKEELQQSAANDN